MVMRTMRRHFGILKYLIVLILLAFLVGFAFSFGGGKFGSNPNAPATVNGEPVSDQLYNRALQNRLDQLRQQYGAELPAAETRKARREVLDSLVEQTLILQNARKYGLTVSDDELAQVIRSNFRDRSGTFNQQGYQDYLNQQAQDGVSPSEVEESFRQNMVLRKATQEWDAQAKVSQQELLEGLAKIHRQVKAQVLVWLYKPLQAKQQVTEDQLKDYYAEHRQEWAKSEEVKARHILIKVDPQSGPDADAKAKAKADDIVKQLKAGKSFAELARKNSDDPGSAKKGGDLGFFGKGMMVPEFEKTAFSLKIGQISDPVKSQFGYHIIQVQEKKPAFDPTFANSRDKARDELTLNKARQQAEQAANLALANLDQGKSLEEVAKDGGAELRSTGWFNRADEKVVPELGKEANIARSLVNLDKGAHTSQPLFLEKGVVLGVLTDEKAGSPAKKEDEAKEKQEVYNRLRGEKAQVLFDGWIKSLKAQAKIQENDAVTQD